MYVKISKKNKQKKLLQVNKYFTETLVIFKDQSYNYNIPVSQKNFFFTKKLKKTLFYFVLSKKKKKSRRSTNQTI